MAAKEETTEDFASRVIQMYAGGMVMLSMSVGSKTELIDKMLTFDEPKTSSQIAEETGLKERYVREWLWVMTAAKITDLHTDTGEDRFVIPKHRRDTLPMFTGFSQVLPVLAQVTDELTNCFKKDGPSGIPHANFKGYAEWSEMIMRTQVKKEDLLELLKQAPGLVEALESGMSFCEIGCSTGNVALQLAELFPNSEIYGLDIDEGSVELARKNAAEKSLPNCHFLLADGADMPAEWTEKWDCVYMYEVLHDISHTTKALSEFWRILKKGGYLSVIETNLHSSLEKNMGSPKGPLFSGFSLFYCLSTSLSAEGSEGWGATWGWEKAIEVIKDAGFRDVKAVPTSDDEWVIHLTARK